MYHELIVEDIEDLVLNVLAKADYIDYPLAFIARYNDAKNVLKNLLKYDDVDIDCIELFPDMYDNYDLEYLIVLDVELNINCEKLISKDNVPLRFDASHVYIMGDCNHRCVKCIDDEKINVVLFNSDIDECEPDVPCCKCSKYECDNYHTPEKHTIKIETNLESKDVERMLDLFEMMIDLEKEFDERFPVLF